LAYEALPEDIYAKEESDNIEIMYKKQIHLNDPITCIYSNEENKNIVTIKSKDEKTLHAIVKLF
jgi:acyl-ACP thioesterase